MEVDSIEVIIGTYENYILGLRSTQNVADNNYSLETSFTDDSHRGALRCLAISANGILASSSTDDSVRLHNIRKRKEIGGLFQHSGTVNSLTFYGKSHMFSASEDGTVCMWKSKNWELLRTLKGHKAKVMGIAVHPTGKLGFSVGGDKSLLTWDLLTGKLAFQRKLHDVAESIHFTPSGDHYILQFSRKIEFCNIEDTKTVKEIAMEWRMNSLAFINENLVAVGGEDRCVHVLDLTTGTTLMTLDCGDKGQSEFNSRVKSVKVLEGKDGAILVFAGTAKGVIKAFKLDLTQDDEKSELVLSYNASVRLTCMAVYNHNGPAQQTGNQKAKDKSDMATSPATTAKAASRTQKDRKTSDEEEKGDTSEDEVESEKDGKDDHEEDEEDEEEEEEEMTPVTSVTKVSKGKLNRSGQQQKRKTDHPDTKSSSQKKHKNGRDSGSSDVLKKKKKRKLDNK